MTDHRKFVVSNTEEFRTAMDAGYSIDEIEVCATANSAETAVATSNAYIEGLAIGRIEGARKGREQGAIGERERVKAINELYMAGFHKERIAALIDGISAAEFAIIQAKAMKDRGITLDAIMRDSPPPAAHAAPSSDDGHARKDSWDSVVAKHQAGNTQIKRA